MIFFEDQKIYVVLIYTIKIGNKLVVSIYKDISFRWNPLLTFHVSALIKQQIHTFK